jgi:hypothetical protein
VDDMAQEIDEFIKSFTKFIINFREASENINKKSKYAYNLRKFLNTVNENAFRGLSAKVTKLYACDPPNRGFIMATQQGFRFRRSETSLSEELSISHYLDIFVTKKDAMLTWIDANAQKRHRDAFEKVNKILSVVEPQWFKDSMFKEMYKFQECCMINSDLTKSNINAIGVKYKIDSSSHHVPRVYIGRDDAVSKKLDDSSSYIYGADEKLIFELTPTGYHNILLKIYSIHVDYPNFLTDCIVLISKVNTNVNEHFKNFDEWFKQARTDLSTYSMIDTILAR